ncbi:MAG TPA: hypothetical protein VJX67_22930, partial [Blastocatellia bacterium]|nr:hypothetical protein [Blastocatellia bacterium]
MTDSEQWKVLSAWIRGLNQAALFYGQFIAGRKDAYGGGDTLRLEAEAVLEALQAFRATYKETLQTAVAEAVDDFIRKNERLIRDATGSPEEIQNRTWVAFTALAALEARVSFLLSDTQEVIRFHSERAFVHLQRSIVVDSEVREKWKQAFKEGEPACEKLGSVHLLLHGIWAFKVHSTGARTDLVLQ